LSVRVAPSVAPEAEPVARWPAASKVCCAAGQPAFTHVSRGIGLPGSDRWRWVPVIDRPSAPWLPASCRGWPRTLTRPLPGP